MPRVARILRKIVSQIWTAITRNKSVTPWLDVTLTGSTSPSQSTWNPQSWFKLLTTIQICFQECSRCKTPPVTKRIRWQIFKTSLTRIFQCKRRRNFNLLLRYRLSKTSSGKNSMFSSNTLLPRYTWSPNWRLRWTISRMLSGRWNNLWVRKIATSRSVSRYWNVILKLHRSTTSRRWMRAPTCAFMCWTWRKIWQRRKRRSSSLIRRTNDWTTRSRPSWTTCVF